MFNQSPRPREGTWAVLGMVAGRVARRSNLAGDQIVSQ